MAGACAASTSAQVPAGPELRVDTDQPWCERDPAIASDRTGGFVLAWDHCHDISARRYDAAGSPKGGEFRVNTDTSSNPDDFRPSIASDPAGNFTVMWQRTWWNEPSFGFPFRMYDASGSPLGPERSIGRRDGWPTGKGGIAADAAGNLAVTWSRMPPDFSASVVFAQLFDGSGAPRGAEFQVSRDGDYYNNSSPRVASNALGDFVVVWGRSSWPGRRSK